MTYYMTSKTVEDLMGSKFVEPNVLSQQWRFREQEVAFLWRVLGPKCPEIRRKMFTERNGKEILSLAFRDTRKKRRKHHQMIVEFSN